MFYFAWAFDTFKNVTYLNFGKFLCAKSYFHFSIFNKLLLPES